MAFFWSVCSDLVDPQAKQHADLPRPKGGLQYKPSWASCRGVTLKRTVYEMRELLQRWSSRWSGFGGEGCRCNVEWLVGLVDLRSEKGRRRAERGLGCQPALASWCCELIFISSDSPVVCVLQTLSPVAPIVRIQLFMYTHTHTQFINARRRSRKGNYHYFINTCP
jgi:hypothetical protein